MSKSDYIVFSQIEFAAVTKDGLQDVSIMSKGEARGHGIMVDEKTIEQFMQISMGKTISAYLTHDGAIGEDGRPKDRLGKEVGVFSGFYRDGDKVRAKNFKFLDAFRDAEKKTYETLMELAKNFSDKLGISPVLSYVKAWVLKDGTEVKADGDNVPTSAAYEYPAMRPRSVLSCDFVQKPATNVGLFNEVDDSPNNKSTKMTAETILLSKHTEEVASLSTQHKDAIAALETKHIAALAILEKKANDAVAALAAASEKEKSLTAALAAKTSEAEDSAKYDMRKAGAPALQIALAAHTQNLPVAAGTDQARWEQYASLCEAVKDPRTGVVLQHKETPAAVQFREKYLDKK